MRLRLKCSKRPGLQLRGFKSNEDGATAVEFAAVALPFFILVFGLIAFAMFFFVMNSLDKGMDQTSRQIRTGQAQKADWTVNKFKEEVCKAAGEWIKCNKVQVFVQKYPDWQSVAPKACVNVDGTVVTNPAGGNDKISTYSGTASDIVVVTTCYEWEFAQQLPRMLSIGNMNNKSMMMQTSTAFRTEPYAAGN